ncbi:hypothetical protein [Nocardioides sp. zg-1228]|uniref:hypothetical protein n=1 Tax=Nocardioides sp. zg-1228 TaxID=2763008 RepID=UPI001642BF6E|nr:hypothetical protein [Nocardioides sp. zg-1228]MBC2934929.1 hypothetical protein [Nocardioides sp. zg-1228]QSF56107.1 hypothetical protein JX575_10480 [Nocardioides sp. zg-1228]
MRQSRTFDPSLHAAGGPAAEGRCSYHRSEQSGDRGDPACAGEAVVSFEDGAGGWESGCRTALEDLVERGEIEPLGQGA